MKVKKNYIKNKLTTIYIVLFFICMLFGFNDEHLTDSIVYKNMVIPHFNINITIVLCIISAGITILFMILKKCKFDNIFLVLFMRIIFYSIPIFYINGDFKIGVYYAIIQCVFSYFIGINSNKTIDELIKLLFFYSIAICIEIFYVLLINRITPFSDDLKWFMILPMGRNNYIACVLMPIYVMVINYFDDRKIFQWVYFLIIFIAILSTGSRLALILFLSYSIYHFLSKYVMSKKISKKRMTMYAIEFLFIVSFVFLLLTNYSGLINNVTKRFLNNNIFESRLLVYKDSLRYIYENPILGRSAYSYTAYDVVKAHNFFLESLVQTGIVGTLLYIICLYIVIKRINDIKDYKIKKTIKAFFIMYLVQGAIEPNLFGVASDTFFWLIIGIGINNTYISEEKL